MSEYAFFLFGYPRLERNGRPVYLTRRKEWGLLAYLLVGVPRHSRDELAALFWPELELAAARANLRKELFRLKQILGEPFFNADRETMALDPTADVWVDVGAFRRALAAAGRHRHPTGALCPDCLEHMTRSIDLYTEDFLKSFAIEDAPAFEEWRFFAAEGLRQQMVDVLKRLVEEFSIRGEYQLAIELGQRWLTLDPLHEPVYRQLMRLYAWSGRRSTALGLYRLCRRKLAAGLEMKPAATTTILYEAIKTRRFTALPHHKKRMPAAPVVGLVGWDAPNLPAALPIQETTFVGRLRERRVIQDYLRDSERQVLTLIGPHGVGKTRLLIEAALAENRLFADGVCYLPLAGIDVGQFAGEINPLIYLLGEKMGLPFHGGTDPLVQLLEFFDNHQFLLIFDDFDNLLRNRRYQETPDLLAAMTRHAPGLQILIASRRRLGITGDCVLMLQGLPHPDRNGFENAAAFAGVADHYSAIDLFSRRAGRVQADFKLEEDFSHVVRICHALRGLPLGIELAAALVDELSSLTLADQIEAGVRRLKGIDGNGHRADRALPFVFGYSWRHLGPAEQRVFRKFSVFRRAFPARAAEAVTRASPAELASLVKKGLLWELPDGLFSQHSLMRKFAADRLCQEPDELAEVTAALAHWLQEHTPDH